MTTERKCFTVGCVTSQVGMTDGDYTAIVQQLLLPIAYEVNVHVNPPLLEVGISSSTCQHYIFTLKNVHCYCLKKIFTKWFLIRWHDLDMVLVCAVRAAARDRVTRL